MTDEIKTGLRHHVMAGLRDVLVVITVISVLTTALVSVTRPYWQPFANIPATVLQMQIDLATIQATLSANEQPSIVDFQAQGLVVNGHSFLAGDTLQVLYSLRRNIGCETIVQPIFWNVDRGSSFLGDAFPAQRAPVTTIYQPFSVSVEIPDRLPPGRYVYYPEIEPQDCGVYERIRVPPTDIFTVERRSDAP